MIYDLLAKFIALTHLSFVALVIVGAPLASRYPKIIKFHIAALISALVINLTGSDCPLTVAEKALIRTGGNEPYESGFNSHYLVEPFYEKGITGKVNLVILLILIIPTIFGYRRVLRLRTAS